MNLNLFYCSAAQSFRKVFYSSSDEEEEKEPPHHVAAKKAESHQSSRNWVITDGSGSGRRGEVGRRRGCRSTSAVGGASLKTHPSLTASSPELQKTESQKEGDQNQDQD